MENSGNSLKIKITGSRNPFRWYRDKIGEIFIVRFSDSWGRYIVLNRMGMYHDDYCIDQEDCEIISD